MLKLSCSDVSIIGIIPSISAGSIIVITVFVIAVSYSYILITILKMHSTEGRHKAFSTCTSHLTAVTLFYGTVTFVYVIPKSSHYLSRRKLALTIGIKAANHEWVILTDADCRPESERWLTTMATHCTDENDIVLGYTNYEHNSKRFYRFERILNACYLMRKAQKSVAYRIQRQQYGNAQKCIHEP